MVTLTGAGCYDCDMRVIDAMTGASFHASSFGVTFYPEGKRPTISYPDLEGQPHALVISRVDAGIPGLRPATFYGWSLWKRDGRIVGEDVHGQLAVKFLHPRFPLQHVAFIPS